MHAMVKGDNIVFNLPVLERAIGDIERTYSSSILWIDNKCELPRKKRFGLHTSIHIEQDDFGDGLLSNFNAVDMHVRTLREYLKDEELKWIDRIELMRKLALAIEHKHQACVVHGSMSEDLITIRLGDCHPFIWPCEEQDTRSTLSSDIEELGKIFYYILTDGNKLECQNGDNEIDEHAMEKCLKSQENESVQLLLSLEPIVTAKGLIKSMTGCTGEQKINIIGVLNHPVFWSSEDKANFICVLYDSLSNKQSFDEMERIFEKKGHKIFDGNWVDEQMEIYSPELTAIKRRTGRANKDLFYNLAMGQRKDNFNYIKYRLNNNGKLIAIEEGEIDKKQWKELPKDGCKSKMLSPSLKKKYPWMTRSNDFVITRNGEIYKRAPIHDGNSLYELIRFIRQRKVHCWVDTKPSQRNLERRYYRELLGFWNFYSKRFPELLVFLYDNLHHFPFFCEDRPFSNAFVECLHDF